MRRRQAGLEPGGRSSLGQQHKQLQVQPADRASPACACASLAASPAAGQNVRKLVKDGFIIRKPQKIHSRFTARAAAEAKAKGRHTGYGASLAAGWLVPAGLGLAVGWAGAGSVLLQRQRRVVAHRPASPMQSDVLCFAAAHPPRPHVPAATRPPAAPPCRQAPRYPRGAPAHQGAVDPPHAGAAPAAQEVPRQQED